MFIFFLLYYYTVINVIFIKQNAVEINRTCRVPPYKNIANSNARKRPLTKRYCIIDVTRSLRSYAAPLPWLELHIYTRVPCFCLIWVAIPLCALTVLHVCFKWPLFTRCCAFTRINFYKGLCTPESMIIALNCTSWYFSVCFFEDSGTIASGCMIRINQHIDGYCVQCSSELSG